MNSINDRDDFSDDETEDQKPTYKPPLFNEMSLPAIIIEASYIIGLSLLLTFFYKAGKYIEYSIPFHLLETNFVTLLIISSILGISSLSAFLVIKLSLPVNSHIQHRTQKITDYFAAITTFSIAFYFITIISSIFKLRYFPIESLYLFIIYGLVLFFYFIKKESHLAYNLVSSGFIITLLITSFYLGRNIAKIEDKLIVTISDEAYGLVATYNDNIILSGYNRASKSFNGKMKIIHNNSYKDLVFILNKVNYAK